MTKKNNNPLIAILGNTRGIGFAMTAKMIKETESNVIVLRTHHEDNPIINYDNLQHYSSDNFTNHGINPKLKLINNKTDTRSIKIRGL